MSCSGRYDSLFGRSLAAVTAFPEDVWQMPTNFGAYPQWNPFTRPTEGNPEAGSRLTARR
jgi:hypothetical protein